MLLNHFYNTYCENEFRAIVFADIYDIDSLTLLNFKAKYMPGLWSWIYSQRTDVQVLWIITQQQSSAVVSVNCLIQLSMHDNNRPHREQCLSNFCKHAYIFIFYKKIPNKYFFIYFSFIFIYL
jgi:hypothetical protein